LQDGHNQIANGIADMMKNIISGNSIKTDETSKNLMMPFVEGMIIEGSSKLKEPCYSDNLVNPTNDPKCLPGSKWN